MAGEIDDIRARIRIVDLVSQKVALKKAGKDWKGLCPFHDDRNPSFTVNEALGRYRCWACGEHGDIFTWVMKTQNVEFVEALQILAQQAGVTLSRSQTSPEARSERLTMYAAMEEALAFFREQLRKSTAAQEYLKNRGIDDSTAVLWDLGYAPEVGDALATHLKRKGFRLATCRELFLVEEDSSGGYYDKFKGRLIFPIRDDKGDVVAFGGRILGDGFPKYINSSDTPLYKKSRVLYGLNAARVYLSKARVAVLTEGYLDVIACHRAGVGGAVASLGTALSEEHAKLLKRWADEVVILYDADKAGQNAAEKAIDILGREKLNVRVALMPAGEDPDTLLRSQGAAAVVKAVESAASPISFVLDRIVDEYPDHGPDFWAAAVEALVNSRSIVEMEQHVERLVGRYAQVEDQLYIRESLRKQIIQRRREINQDRRRNEPYTKPKAPPPQKLDLPVSEAAVFAALVEPEFRQTAHEALLEQDLVVSPKGSQLAAAYRSVFSEGMPSGEPSIWLSKFDDPAMEELISQCARDARFEHLTMNFIKDAIETLGKQAERRKLERFKKEPGSTDLEKLTQKLRHIKGAEEQAPDDLR